MVSVDPYELLWAVINFLILMFLLYKFLWKPMNNALEKRQSEIAESLATAEKSREEARNLQATFAAQVEAARKEAREIVEQAQKAGDQAKAEIIAQANQSAAKMIEAAEVEIERKKMETISELKGQMAELVILASSRILSDTITDQQQHNLVDKYIEEVGNLQ